MSKSTASCLRTTNRALCDVWAFVTISTRACSQPRSPFRRRIAQTPQRWFGASHGNVEHTDVHQFSFDSVVVKKLGRRPVPVFVLI